MAALQFTVHSVKNLDTIADKLRRACDEAQHTVAIQIRKDTEPFVPKLTGSLRNTTKVTGNTITYPGPYAHYLYEGFVWVDPNTKSSFAKKGVTKVKTGKKLKLKHDNPDPQAEPHWFEVSKLMNEKKWERVAEEAITHDFKK